MEVKYPVNSFFVCLNFVKKMVMMKKEKTYLIDSVVDKKSIPKLCNMLIINIFVLSLGVELLPFFFEFKQAKFEL